MPTPQKRKPPVRRESDLQPIYDVVDALQPDQLKAAYNRMDRRTRYMVIMLIATLVLAWAMLTAVRLLSQHISATTGPFLMDALKAPYNLDARTLPTPIDAQTTVLPAAVADFARLDETVKVIVPVDVSEGQPDAGDVEQAATGLEALAGYPLAGCLATAASNSVESACVPFRAQYVTFGDYQIADGSRMNVTAAQFVSDADATDAVKALSHYAGSIGRVGNYVLGVGAVDYFNSAAGNYHIFTWSHGMWVYTMTHQSLPALESAMKVFPY
jgi:hypothetical protein